MHRKAPETASDCVCSVSAGLLQKSSTTILVSVVVCWLFIRNRTAENILKWKNKDWRAIVISQVLSSKLGNLVEVGNLLYLDSPSHIDRQNTMGGNCSHWFFNIFFMCSMIWKTDNWEWLINLDINLCTVGDSETLAWKFRADSSQLSFKLLFQWKNYF